VGKIHLGNESVAEVPVAATVAANAMATRAGQQAVGFPESASEPTPTSVWYAASGGPISDRLLEWPADVFALTEVVLARAEAFRYALSVHDWPPQQFADWADAVAEAARNWSAWAEDRRGSVPDLVATEWGIFREGSDVPLERLGAGDEPRLNEALLTLHAMADEACAGLGGALDTSDAQGCVYRARGRELLARTGSLARISTRYLRVFPKVSTAPLGRPAFSRYACVLGPCINARWHKMPARRRGTDLRSEETTLLLLPWPLQVRASDFRPVPGGVDREHKDPDGFFEFAPAEALDLDLLDRVLVAARQEAGCVDVVMLPESAVDEREIDGLEALLHAHGVAYLQTGVRQPGRFPANSLHIGVHSSLEKGRPLSGEGREPWFHLRQNKHHRWMLDETQVHQYHLGGALHPHIRWWEAMEVPTTAIELVEVAESLLVPLVCQDLADQNDDIGQLIRSVGPNLVLTALLDGPQLSSRWSSRYASVLADDPGSAVLTLTPLGMVERSRPYGLDASRVIALWKDGPGGAREIALEPGAQAVLLTVALDRATRYTADRRWPVDNGTSCDCVAVYQVRASDSRSSALPPPATPPSEPALDSDELAILTCWAEGVSEAAAFAPERVDDLLEEARAGATWRSELGLPGLSTRLADAMESLGRLAREGASPPGTPLIDALLNAGSADQPDEEELDRLVRRAMLSMLEERQTRVRT
jgi:hypothetical protein